MAYMREIFEKWIRSTPRDNGDNNLGFTFGNFMLAFDEGKISVSHGNRVFAQYDIIDFSRSPNAVFRQIQRDMRMQQECP